MKSGLIDLYEAKNLGYFGNARHDYVRALPDDPGASVLELGCASGATGALALAQKKCSRWVGIELHEPSGLQAREILTEVHIGDVEMMALPFEAASFDALVCSEVLEHLIDPERTLKKLASFLKPGARVYASVPNITHYRVVIDLFLGKFDYRDFGVMDRTHLRWFTPKTLRNLFEVCGIAVDELIPLPDSRFRRFASKFPLGHLAWCGIDLHGHRPS